MDHLELEVKTKDGEDTLQSTVWSVCTAICPNWDSVPKEGITVTLITGGITNLLYKVSSSAGALLVRVYGDNTELVIDREKEMAVLLQMSAQKFSVQVYGSFANGRIEEFMEMRSLKPEEMRSRTPTDYPAIIAKQLARMHGLKVDVPKNELKLPKLFSLINAWATTASALSFDDTPARAALFTRLRLGAMREELRWAMSVLPSELNHYGADLTAKAESPAAKAAMEHAFKPVLCHNDLLSGNIMVDGELSCRLIDFEYCDYNHRAFDLANHLVEYAGFDGDWGKWHPTEEEMLHFIKAYVEHSIEVGSLGPAVRPDAFLQALLRWVQLFCLATHLFWGFWAIIQAKHSHIDFDFLDYSRLRFVGYFYTKGLYARHLFLHVPA